MTGTQQHKCPLGDCRYTAGSARSVENHINGSTTGPHEGESGADHRDEIELVSVDEPGSSAPDRAESADGSGEDNRAGERGEPGSNPLTERGEPDRSERGERGSTAPDCCSDPALDGGRGVVVLGDNHDAERFGHRTRKAPIQLDRELDQPLKLESEDRVCMNCDTIHEEAADG